MPASRKRIGYLPSAEVQKIINKICLKNNLSQSKVTGILVEEALNARNLFISKNKEEFVDIDSNDSLYKSTISSNNVSNNINYNDKDENNEYKLIKEYLDYKKFKRILSIVQSDN